MHEVVTKPCAIFLIASNAAAQSAADAMPPGDASVYPVGRSVNCGGYGYQINGLLHSSKTALFAKHHIVFQRGWESQELTRNVD